mgnify:CR=1 FL=1
MSPTALRAIATAAAVLSVSAVTVSPALATAPVFTESFENCTEPSGSPDYSGYATAVASARPILVKLWIYENLSCPDWTADGQAWMTEYDSGEPFPDGTHAAWLNEGDYSSASGSITRDITGLTPGHDYRLSLETWTDDQDYETSLTMQVTNGSDMSEQVLTLAAGQGAQLIKKEFSAVGDTVTLKLIGSDANAASPIVDNIRITDVGVTGAPRHSHASSTKSSLASTGFDAVSLFGFAGALVAGGALALAARRRRSAR